MKKLLSLLTVLVFSLSMVHAQTAPKITFEKTTHDYGSIAEVDGNAMCSFSFTNTGDAPLIITKASASCGCTKPTYTKKPIAPGESGEISVTYRAAGRPGAFSKSVYIFTNAEPEKSVLVIKGTVIPKPKEEENKEN